VRKLLLATMILCFSVSVHAQHMNAGDSPCGKFAGTSELSACFYKAEQKADGELNRVYSAVLAKLEGEDREGLRDSERLWIQYRDSVCNAEYKLYDGGTAGPPTRMACIGSLTRARIREIHTAYDWLVDK
jgi:uncharacterized protein YecT (DUF1311 family)